MKLYASKHNPFVYFQNVQEGAETGNTLANSVGFETLYGDLGSGNVPTFSFIVPNQCNDQHGRGNAGVDRPTVPARRILQHPGGEPARVIDARAAGGLEAVVGAEEFLVVGVVHVD